MPERSIQRLDGTTVAILATDGYEESELRTPLENLREAGADVRVISTGDAPIRGWSDGDWSEEVDVDHVLADTDAARFDALVLPGGVMNPDSLRQDGSAVAFVQAFAASKKPIAAICHAPWMLVEADLVRDRRVTSWPSVRRDLENAGARWEDEPVVSDGGLITSRKPDDLEAFCRAIVDTLAAQTSSRAG